MRPGCTFGSGEAMLRAIELIGRREGLGDLLAEGSRRAAEAIGHGSIAFAPQVKGLEIPGYEPRALQTMALGFAVGARGADHNRSGAYEVDFSDKVDRRHATLDAVHHAIETEDKAALMDSLILCKFLRGVFEDFYAEAADMLRRVTGWDITADELRETARRIVVGQAAVQPAGRLDARGRHAAGALSRHAAADDPARSPPATEAWSPSITASAAGSRRSYHRQSSAGPAMQCLEVVFARIEIAQRQQLRIDGGHLRWLYAARAHRIEQEHRTKTILCQQRFDLRQRPLPDRPPTADAESRRSPSRRCRGRRRARSSASRSRARAAGHRSWSRRRPQRRRGSAFNPARSPSSGPRPSRSSRVTITPAGSGWQLLIGRGDDDDRRDDGAEQADDALQHRLGPKGSSAFDDPIRVDLPPQRTMPPGRSRRIRRHPIFMPRRSAPRAVDGSRSRP